jgi:hypothetical protein
LGWVVRAVQVEQTPQQTAMSQYLQQLQQLGVVMDQVQAAPEALAMVDQAVAQAQITPRDLALV